MPKACQTALFAAISAPFEVQEAPIPLDDAHDLTFRPIATRNRLLVAILAPKAPKP